MAGSGSVAENGTGLEDRTWFREGAAEDHRVRYHAGAFRNFIAEQGLGVRYRVDGFVLEVAGPEGRLHSAFTLRGVGRDGTDLPLSADAVLAAQGACFTADHGAFALQYQSGADGMRHDVIVRERPGGEGPVEVRFALSGNLLAIPTSNQEVVLHRYEAGAGSLIPVVRYNGLKAWDALGKPVRSHMELRRDELVLVVADQGATYPLTIDPLSSSADLVLSGAGGEGFGHAVRTAGDVNGDGYSDLLVGAPAWGGGRGRVQLFLGSSAGIGATAAAVYTGAQAGDSLGYSVTTTGDMDGDGLGDFAIGVPGKNGGRGQVLLFLGSASGVPTSATYTLNGGSAGEKFGFSVALAGDVNGDGRSDLLVGAPGYSADQGKAYCFHGRQTGMGVNYNTADWSAVGSTQFNDTGQYGFSVAGAGDLNGDGYSDVAIGSPFSTVSRFNAEAGWVFLYRGSAGGLMAATGSPISRSGPNAHFGYSVSTAGDLNGDGRSDLVVGSPNRGSAQNGDVAVYLGAAGNGLVAGSPVIHLPDPAMGTANVRFGHSVGLGSDVSGGGLSTVLVGAPGANGGNGKVVLLGVDPLTGAATEWWSLAGSAGEGLGHCVYAAGDVNGDGLADLALGTPVKAGGAGEVQVFHGTPWMLTTDSIWGQQGSAAYEQYGLSMASAGDLNGDGYSDVVVSARVASNQPGKVYVFYGSATGLSATPDQTITGQKAGDSFGYSVASAGDVNGDGYSDLVVGTWRWPLVTNDDNHYRGKIYVFYGGASGLKGGAPAISAANADWSREGIEENQRFGWNVASAGDVNGDGYSDIIVGAYAFGGNGRAYVFHGSASGLSSAPDWTYISSHNAWFGSSVSTAGDVNGDGYDDVIIGEPNLAGPGSHAFGGVYVFHGSPGGLSDTVSWFTQGSAHNQDMGAGVAFAGDVNGDGYSDVVIGAPGYDGGGLGNGGKGAAYVYHGSIDGLGDEPATQILGVNNGDRTGFSVSSAGDVNGDGYSDVVVGTPRSSMGALQQGKVDVYLGGPGGISTAERWTGLNAPFGGMNNTTNARAGDQVALAGDVNGDGFSDILVRMQQTQTSPQDAGGIWLALGNMGRSLPAPTYQYRGDLSTPVRTNNGTFGADCQWGIGQYLRNAQGRTALKMAWEFAGHGPSVPTNFFENNSVDFTGQEAGWTDAGLLGTLRKQTVTSDPIPPLPPTPLDTANFSHPAWRARARFHPATALDGRVFGRWYRQGVHDGQVPSIKTNLEVCGPLPVTMVAYAVTCQQGVAVLEWSTASERDSKEFVVERSADAHAWEAIGTVAGAGNSEYMRYYGFTDPIGADDGLWYYRLRQVDHNGDFEIFPVLVLTPCHAPGALTAWPNPFEDALNLRLAAPGMDAAGSVQVVVRDLTGRMVLERDLPLSNGTDLRITGWQGLPAGAYLIDVRAPSGASLGQVRAMRL